MFAKKLILLIIAVFTAQLSFGQEKATIAILAKPKKDGVWLRWAPTSHLYWQLGNRHGYLIERFTLQDDGDIEQGSRMLLSQTPIKPYSKSKFQEISSAVDEVAVLGELLYGETGNEDFNPNDIKSLLSKNNEQENKYGMALLMCDLSLEAATAGALFYKDQSAVKGKRYIYRIKIAYENPQLPLEPSATVVNVDEEWPLFKINDLNAEFGDRTATISWSTLMHKGMYSAYYIEKSSDGKNFTRLSKLPYVHITEAQDTDKAYYVDSLDVNQKKYYYRIQGITPFAESGPASNITSGEGKDNLYGLLIIREGKLQENGKIKLEWEFPPEMEKQIAGFMPLKANNPDGLYHSILKKPLLKNERTFLDETQFNNTYYVLQAVGSDGAEVSRSFPYLVHKEDNDPPAVPSGLSGTITQDGIATLKWQPNTEKDLLGYRVFKSNSPSEEFIEVTEDILPAPAFTDSVKLKILNKKIYYSVIAVDKNYNTSDYSAAILLNRPDIIAPAAPVFKNVEIREGEAIMEWINSISDDVAKYELSRYAKPERETTLLKSWHPSEGVVHYKDPFISQGKTYQYTLTVYDSAGNKSEAKTREISFETGVREAISNIKIDVDREAKYIEFKWKNHAPAVKCFVYRKKNDEPLTLYQTIEGNTESFNDKQVAINNTYIYKVQLVYEKGVKSQLSKEVKVTY